MAKKELNGDVAPRELTTANRGSVGLGFIVGIFALCWFTHRAGYNTGVDVSRRILRRHDKDVRRMKKEAAKREKQLKKELQPEEEKKRWWP